MENETTKPVELNLATENLLTVYCEIKHLTVDEAIQKLVIEAFSNDEKLVAGTRRLYSALGMVLKQAKHNGK